MITFPNAKINLGLHVAGRRKDGYHNLETIFYPLPFRDALEINESDDFHFQSTGIECGSAENNLCVKAYHLIKQDIPNLPHVSIHLHKAIPTGAGLGGGSADGAFTLKLLNEKFSLGMDAAQLRGYALQLGSDCPFFIINRPCVALGRGEELTEIPALLKGYHVLLVMSPIHLSTSKVFKEIKIAENGMPIADAITRPVAEWRHFLQNDFEEIVFKMHPGLHRIKTTLYEMGAVYSSMTGTGSSVYGIFEKEMPLPPGISYTTKWLSL